MKRTNNLDDLLENVEKIRAEQFPDIPYDLLKKVIEIEADNIDSRSAGYEQIKKLISSYLADNND